MRRLAALTLCLAATPALAGLVESDIARAGLAPGPGARVPLALSFRTPEGAGTTLDRAIGGRPVLLLPIDYGCRMTCGPALAIVADALARTGLRPGADYRLVLVGLDPDSDGATARAFAAAQVGDPALTSATSVLIGNPSSLRTLTEAIGYGYVRDVENGAFAHPTGLVALTADGRVARALSTLALDATDLRLALVEAGEGRVGGIGDRLALLCYGFDPVHGIYTASVERVLAAAAALTVGALAAALLWLTTRSPRRGRP